jgi:hypothetical protein
MISTGQEEAGIGERSRREEVPPTNDETFAGPADRSTRRPAPNVASRIPVR